MNYECVDAYGGDVTYYYRGRNSPYVLLRPLVTLAVLALSGGFLCSLSCGPVRRSILDQLETLTTANSQTLDALILAVRTLLQRLDESDRAYELMTAVGVAAGSLGVFFFCRVLYAWIRTKYVVSNHRIEYEIGIVAKSITSVDLWRITDIGYSRNWIQAFFGIGIVRISTTDVVLPTSRIGPISGAHRVYDALKEARSQAIRRARARHPTENLAE